MGKMVPRWIANDGQEFVEQRDMLLHELGLIDAKEIDLFIRDKPIRKQTEYRNILKEWQSYQRLQEVEKIVPPPKAIRLSEHEFPNSFPDSPLNQEHVAVPLLGISENPLASGMLDDDFDIDDSFDKASLI